MCASTASSVVFGGARPERDRVVASALSAAAIVAASKLRTECCAPITPTKHLDTDHHPAARRRGSRSWPASGARIPRSDHPAKVRWPRSRVATMMRATEDLSEKDLIEEWIP